MYSLTSLVFTLLPLLADDKTCNHTIHCIIGNNFLEKAIQVLLDFRDLSFIIFKENCKHWLYTLSCLNLQPEDKVLSLPLTHRSWHCLCNGSSAQFCWDHSVSFGHHYYLCWSNCILLLSLLSISEEWLFSCLAEQICAGNGFGFIFIICRDWIKCSFLTWQPIQLTNTIQKRLNVSSTQLLYQSAPFQAAILFVSGPLVDQFLTKQSVFAFKYSPIVVVNKLLPLRFLSAYGVCKLLNIIAKNHHKICGDWL